MLGNIHVNIFTERKTGGKKYFQEILPPLLPEVNVRETDSGRWAFSGYGQLNKRRWPR